MGEESTDTKDHSVIIRADHLPVVGGDGSLRCGHRIISSPPKVRTNQHDPNASSTISDDDVNNNKLSLLCGCGGLLLRRPPFATLVHAAVWNQYITVNKKQLLQ